MSVQNPTVPKNYNCVMSASGWGAIYVKVLTIGHGISIVANSSTQRFSRALYVEKRSSGSFGLVLVCSSPAEHKALGDWIMGYGRLAADPDGQVGSVRVVCPVREFDKVAIPDSVTFGDTYDQITYPVSINFVGSRDPVPYTADFVSSFSMPSGDPDLPYYYPAGHQLSGDVDTLYDQTNVDRANRAATDRLTAQYEAWKAAQGKSWQSQFLDTIVPQGE